MRFVSTLWKEKWAIFSVVPPLAFGYVSSSAVLSQLGLPGKGLSCLDDLKNRFLVMIQRTEFFFYAVTKFVWKESRFVASTISWFFIINASFNSSSFFHISVSSI